MIRRFILRPAMANRRDSDIQHVQAALIAAPLTDALEVSIGPFKQRLPTNLRSRVKILVRELAAFNGITYEEFNGIIHRLYYPKRDRVIAGQTIESSIPTNELTPDEARIIESELYSLGATIGCPLSIPQSK